MACRIHELFNDNGIRYNTFSSSDWVEHSVDYAVREGIVSPSECSNIHSSCSREQMCVFLYRAMPVDTQYLNMYKKVVDSNVYEILELYKLGIVQGVNELAEFKGALPVTRAEMATIACRIIEPEMRIRVEFKQHGTIDVKGYSFPFIVRGNFTKNEIEKKRSSIENLVNESMPEYALAALKKKGGTFGYEQLDLMEYATKTENVVSYYSPKYKRIIFSKIVKHALLHETGHFLQFNYGDMIRGEGMYQQYKDVIADICKNPYAKQNQKEMFAEAYRIFVDNPQSIRVGCPVYYDYINEIINAAKIDQ